MFIYIKTQNSLRALLKAIDGKKSKRRFRLILSQNMEDVIDS